MIGTSTAEWIFIRLSIIIFRYAPALYSGAIAIQTFLHGLATFGSISTRVLSGLLAAEIAFYKLIWQPYLVRLNTPADHPDPLTRSERDKIFMQCLDNVPSTEAYLRGWFLGADISDIRRENLREFILWAFFDKERMDAVEDVKSVRDEIDGYVLRIETRLGYSLRDGRGPVNSLRLTFDKATTAYRGPAWYVVIFLIDQFTHLLFLWNGFQYYARSSEGDVKIFPPRPQDFTASRYSAGADISYWFRSHEAGSDVLPVVFFHGIGVGLWTYMRFLFSISHPKKAGGKKVGVIAIEILPISFRLTAPPPSRVEFVRQMGSILHQHSWHNFALVAHSYGSVLSTHMLRDSAMQQRILSVVLVDPVSILLQLPNVAYNFTRRSPQGANEWQLWYFASTDPCVAHCLSRHFFWRQNIIWKEELTRGLPDNAKRRAAVCLSGRDIITDTASVAKYLSSDERGQVDDAGASTTASVEVAFFPELDHAQAFDDPAGFQRVVQLVQSYCKFTGVKEIH